MQSDGLPLTEVLQIRLRQPRSLLIIENVDSEATATAVAGACWDVPRLLHPDHSVGFRDWESARTGRSFSLPR